MSDDAPTNPNKTFINIKHKEHGGVASVTQASFDAVWKQRGWETTTDPLPNDVDPGEDAAEAEFNVAKAKLPELQAEAERLGLDASGTVAELRERITDHNNAQEG